MSLASLEHHEVEQFTREFEALFNAGDAAGMASYYAEDARLLPEHADLVRGRDAIERFWREAIRRARAADALRTIRLDEVTSSGDLAKAGFSRPVRAPGW
jgi:uncharacterized protein (TIGR02246 family)